MSDLEPIPAGAHVSEHLSWAEATTTQHRDPEILREQKNPPPPIRMNLVRAAADVFEPARALVGSLIVTSAYRCPALNAAIKGAKTSRHMDGLAFDVIPKALEPHDAFVRLAQSGIAFDQLIWEYGEWIHLGGTAHGQEPRRQILAYYTHGEKSVPWRPSDPRFRAAV